MYILLLDTAASADNASYAICKIPYLTYRWFQDISEEIPTPNFTTETAPGYTAFITLRTFINFYTKRDSASFKIIARGSSIPRLIERYPELFI